MSVKSWFKNVKNAIVYEKQSFKTFNDYIDKKNKIYPLEDKYDMPNTKLEQEIRVSICGVLYCMEDPLGGLYYEFPDSVAKNCECFYLMVKDVQIKIALYMRRIVHILMQKTPTKTQSSHATMQLNTFSALRRIVVKI